MIKTFKKMMLTALILAFGTFLSLSCGIIKVNANPEYYVLNNDLINGDFSSSAGFFLVNATITSETLIYNSTSSGYATRGDLYFKDNHIYYASFYVDVISRISGSFGIRIQDNDEVGGYERIATTSIGSDQHISKVFEIGTSGNTWLIGGFDGGSGNAIFDNAIIVDLTEVFGMGNEPSISDFELYYLPDDYFTEYKAYEPEIYDWITSSDLDNDDTAIDWTKSLIGKNGKNITLSIYCYLDTVVYDAYGNLIDNLGYFFLDYPVEVYYYDQIYYLDWIPDPTDYHLFTLDMTDDASTTALLSVLFDRSFSADNYASFPVAYFVYEDEFEDPIEIVPNYWLDIRTDFVYNVNIGGVVISSSETNPNEVDISNDYWLKFYDNEDNIIQPSLRLLGLGGIHNSRLYSSFQSKYNNIQSFRLSLDLTPITGESAIEEYYYQNIHEINVFAVDTVLLVNPPLDDVADLFPTTIVEWYDIAGHLKNLFNEVAGAIYEWLNIAEISAVFNDIIDGVHDLSDFIPPAIQSAFLIIVAIGSLGIIIVLAEKFL